ncbi:hypothetical protein H5410_041893 [Solanum commersonii]|uniref:Uncharacterized protein n=1 Tax=Solanum commersonii TaxID=4109 RepID=A0A9J5XSU7_SOLCO|nr:hypothetical protein H5410_041893 [Solanum commersonii]
MKESTNNHSTRAELLTEVAHAFRRLPITTKLLVTGEEEDTIENILKAITTLSTKVDSMDNEIQKLKTNEDNLKSRANGKNPELKGDDGKLLKTHNVCLNTAAAEILYEKIKPPIQVVKIGLTKDMIISEDIGQQPEIQKNEIPSFYANKRIIGISTIIQELANNYLSTLYGATMQEI